MAKALRARLLRGEEVHPVAGEVFVQYGTPLVDVADHQGALPDVREQVVVGHPAVVLVDGRDDHEHAKGRAATLGGELGAIDVAVTGW